LGWGAHGGVARFLTHEVHFDPCCEHFSLLTILYWMLMIPIASLVLVRVTAFWADVGSGTLFGAVRTIVLMALAWLDPARSAPAVAPHDPPRQADACRSAIGRPVLRERGLAPGRKARSGSPHEGGF
jgi:hypothetical protein